MIYFSLFLQERVYYAIPRYGLTKEYIEKECEKMIHHYKKTPDTKIIMFFLEKLFDMDIVIQCSAAGKKKDANNKRRPQLDLHKREAILGNTLLGF